MRVEYTLQVSGELRIAETGNVRLDRWEFQFNKDAKGHVNELVVTIHNVPQENWPTLIAVEQDPNAKIPSFPFRTNPEAWHFHKALNDLINVESFLSVFGLHGIDFSQFKESWISEPGDEQIGIQSGMAPSFAGSGYVSDPLTDADLAACIVSAGQIANVSAAFAYFRVGQEQFRLRRYVDAIRYLYLCLEFLFAKGNHRQRQTVDAFMEDRRLAVTVENFFLRPKRPNAYFTRLRSKYPRLAATTDVRDFYNFLFDLRGRVQHANVNRPDAWHPSRQEQFEAEAVCVMQLAEAVCSYHAHTRIETVINAAPISPTSQDPTIVV